MKNPRSETEYPGAVADLADGIAPIPPRGTRSGETSVELSGVEKVFHSQNGQRAEVLRDVSLTVERSSFVSVVGRSGCGKSTLLRLIAGLDRASGGEIRVGGAPVRGPVPEARYVFQDYGKSLLPWKTARANLAFGLRHGNRRNGIDAQSEIDAMLDVIGLRGRDHLYPWQLSGGMQQRVALGRAILAKPSLLLMDEPFSSVDALSRAQLQDMVLKLWEDTRVTIVFVTHDVDEAVYLSDRIIVLDPGRKGVQIDLASDVPRPRTQVATREAPEFLRCRRLVLSHVLGETLT